MAREKKERIEAGNQLPAGNENVNKIAGNAGEANAVNPDPVNPNAASGEPDYKAAYETEKAENEKPLALVEEMENNKVEREELLAKNEELMALADSLRREISNAQKAPEVAKTPYVTLLDLLTGAERAAAGIVSEHMAAGLPASRMRRIQNEIHQLVKTAKVYV